MNQLKVLLPVGLAMAIAGCSGADAQRPASSLTVIPHEKLREFLPGLDGWAQERPPQGDTDTTENFSRVQVDYAQTGGIGGLGIEITDTAMNPDILRPLTDFIRAGRVEQIGDPTAPVTVTPMKVKDHPAKQEWQPYQNANNGSLTILIAGRFTVGITGNSLRDSTVMTWAAERMPLDKIASLK